MQVYVDAKLWLQNHQNALISWDVFEKNSENGHQEVLSFIKNYSQKASKNALYMKTCIFSGFIIETRMQIGWNSYI